MQDLLLEAMFHNNLDFARFAHDIVGDEMTQLAAMRHPVSENSGHYEFIEGNLRLEIGDTMLYVGCQPRISNLSLLHAAELGFLAALRLVVEF